MASDPVYIAQKEGGCKYTRLLQCSYDIAVFSYAILFTARVMRDTFLAEVFLW